MVKLCPFTSPTTFADSGIPPERGPARNSMLIKVFRLAGIAFIATFSQLAALAQLATFAGNAQHTGQYEAMPQHLDRIRWTALADLYNAGGWLHYGAPLITPSNTVILPIRNTNGFLIRAYEGGTGRLKYTLSSDYIAPVSNWEPEFEPVLADHPAGTRLYYAGPGGTIYYVTNPDSDTPGTPVQLCFYEPLADYYTNAATLNNRVFVNTPITADTNGTIFFGFRIQSVAPAPLNTTNGGIVRINAADSASYVFANDAAQDGKISRVSHNCAPALSRDGSTLYVAMKWTNAFYAYLVGLDTTTLATKYRAQLRDPRNGNFAGVPDDGTASPTVAPDGDVFFGVLGNPGNGGRGFLLHFSSDLKTQMPPSGFGWDYTPAIVPTNMLPGYTGSAPYLLFSKYNNYAGNNDGDGVNRIALLDPVATQIDPHVSSPGLVEMREILTVLGCTPDDEYFGLVYPQAVREWCINSTAINLATHSIFSPSEDGHIYRWNLAENALSEVFRLGPGVGAPYVPTVLAPDGTIYTLNGGTLFALGSETNVSMRLDSSSADSRFLLAGAPVTFTATLENRDTNGPVPSGTVTFLASTFDGLVSITNTIAADVPLSNGVAAVSTTNLAASSNLLGNYFITVTYTGDTNFGAAAVTRIQKVHQSASQMSLVSALALTGTNAVILTATVTGTAGTNHPTGMVSFWDADAFLGQVPLKTNGTATVTISSLASGTHSLRADYASDTRFAASSASPAPTPFTVATLLTNSALQLGFSNVIGASFSVLGATDLTLSSNAWTNLGTATEISPGQYTFSDSVTGNSARFYRIRSP